MKLKLMLMLISLNTIANPLNSISNGESYTCEAPQLTKDIGDISNILGELTHDACNETSNDVDLLNLIKCIPNTIEQYQKNKIVDKSCEGVSKPGIAALFLSQLVGDKKPGSKTNKEKSSIVDFMLMEGKAVNSSKEKVISELQRNVLQFASKTSCHPGKIKITRKISHSLQVASVKLGDRRKNAGGVLRSDSDLSKELREVLKSDEFLQKQEQRELNNKRKYGQLVWSEKIEQNNCSSQIQKDIPRTYTRRSLPSPTCSQRVEINFANDSDKITSQNLNSLLASDKYKSLQKCISKYKEQNLTIKGIKIDGSANRFTGKNRPGEMKEAVALNKDLALRRAQSTSEQILEKLVGSELYSSFEQSGKKVVVSAKGQHGDGTSGPCPYSTKVDSNGRYTVKPEFKDKDSLKKYRYANITVSFEDLKARELTQAEKNKKTRKAVAFVNCRAYTISCKR